jgi:hypothetical protein
VPIRIDPFDSPDRRPNRMVEMTTSCRLTPYCAGSPSLATTQSRDPRLAAEIRSWGTGDACLGRHRSSPPGAGALDSVGSAVESIRRGRRTPPGGEVTWNGTETAVSGAQKRPEPTRTFTEQERSEGRQTTRNQ